VLVLGLGLGLVSGGSLVGVCRRLAAVVSVTYTTVVYTTVVSIVDLWSIHDGRVRNINQKRKKKKQDEKCPHLLCRAAIII